MRSSSVHGDVGTRVLAGVVNGLAVGSSCALGVQTFLGFLCLVAISLFYALDNKDVCCGL